MPPKDRRERMHERLRGAGESHATANFAFNFATAPAPVQPPPRRTPRPRPSAARKTPESTRRNAPDSATAQRSASTTIAADVRNTTTPRASLTRARINQAGPQRTVTPVASTGKRKRGQPAAITAAPEDEQDELEREDEDYIASAQKSTLPRRRASVTASPPVVDDEPDELDAADEDQAAQSAGNAGRRTSRSAETTPTPVVVPTNRASTVGGRATPSSRGSEGPDTLRRAALIRSGARASSEAANPVTPAAGSGLRAARARPAVAEPDMDDLSPEPESITPLRATVRASRTSGRAPDNTEIIEREEEDELSPETANAPRRPQHVLEDELSPAPGPRRPRSESVEEQEEVDELSPDPELRASRRPTVERDEGQDEEEVESRRAAARRKRKQSDGLFMSSAVDSNIEEEEEEGAEAGPSRRPALRPIDANRRRVPPKPARKKHSVAPGTGIRKPSKKRPKRSGGVFKINVHRIKMPKTMDEPDWVRYGARVNAPEALHQYFDEMLTEDIQNINANLGQLDDRALERREKSKIGVTQVFQACLSDLFLDISTAANNNSILTGRIKEARKKRIGLHKEYMRVWDERNELVLGMDQIREEYQQSVQARERSTKLNESMFAIQAAIEAGREKARSEQREDEGPEIPVEVLLSDLGRVVGSERGGLLAGFRDFNGMLEKTADVLEGRA